MTADNLLGGGHMQGANAPGSGGAPTREGFMELVRKAEGYLLRTARRLCKGGEDCAQDLVQDALVRGYEAYRQGKYRDEHSPQAWLTRILTNNFINEYRRKLKWDAGVDVDTLTSGGEAGPTSTHAPAAERPGAALMEQTLDEPIERALQKLPDALRVTVILVDIHEYSYQEAAEIMEIPVGTVRSRLSRARYMLQDWLHDYAKERRLV